MSHDLPADLLPLRPSVLHILLALSQGPLHGLGIADDAESASSGAVRLGPGTLYRALGELSDAGWVLPDDPPEGADPRRKYYRISPAGQALLAAELRRMEALVREGRSREALPERA